MLRQYRITVDYDGIKDFGAIDRFHYIKTDLEKMHVSRLLRQYNETCLKQTYHTDGRNKQVPLFKDRFRKNAVRQYIDTCL